MKLNITRKIATAVTLLSLSAFSGTAQAQCFTASYGAFPTTAVTPNCNGEYNTIASNCWAGEYSLINVISGTQYSFSSSNPNDYITISNDAGTSSYATGTGFAVWTANITGSVRFYTHTDAACGEEDESRARRVACGTLPQPPVCATLIAPADGAANLPVNPGVMLSWSAVAGASAYRVYTGTTPATMAYIGEIAATSVNLVGNSPNTTTYWYIVPVNTGGAATGCSSGMRSFTTGALTNDDCTGAIALTQTGGAQYVTAIGATESQPACAGDASFDVWYSVTTDNAGDLTISAQPLSGFDMVLEVFSGSCSGLTSLGCQDDYASGTESFTITGAAANATYYFRVHDYDGQEGLIGAVGVNGTALPVTMDKLQGKVNDRGLAQLNWKTLSEQNNKGFEIQRSTDGIDFRTVGFVGTKAPQGNSKEAINYNFTDADMVTGTAYYRLVQTDIDGRTAQSNTVRLSATVAGRFELVAVPNPVKDKVSIRINGERAMDAMVWITDLSGKVVRQLQVTADETDVDMSSVAQGIYLLKYTDANHTQTVKITKQ